MKKQPKYLAVLESNNIVYKGSGDNLAEALGSIKPETYKTKGVLKIKYGDKEATKLLYIGQMKRLFTNETARLVMSKYLEQSIK